MGVWELFQHGARAWPARACLADASGTSNYAEVAAWCSSLAAGFQSTGPTYGVKIAILSPNCSASMCAVLAVHAAQAIFVPLNASFPVEDHISAINDLGVEMVLFHSTFANDVTAMLATSTSLREAVCIHGNAGVGTPVEQVIARAHGTLPADQARHSSDIVAIYPTGGSTGRPKRVMHSRLNWTTMAASFHTALPVTGHPIYLLAPPLTHAAGTFALMLMAAGATTIIHNGFDAGNMLATIDQQKVTHVYLPPTAIYKLLDHPDLKNRDYSSLQAFIYTAAPMAMEKLRECIATFGKVMVQFWGQMEAPSFCTCLSPEDHTIGDPALSDRLLSCGRETMFTQVEVMDDEGKLLAAGERGELVVRGNLVMAGYYGNPEATADVSRNGWHLTGDVGVKDAAGYVYIVGRKRDLIITGGYNVYPADVEQAVLSHPDVQECAVIGIPDELWGESVLAVVQLKHGRTLDADVLIAFCKERIGSIKAPKNIEVREEIPRNAIGKVDKMALREPFWRGKARSV